MKIKLAQRKRRLRILQLLQNPYTEQQWNKTLSLRLAHLQIHGNAPPRNLPPHSKIFYFRHIPSRRNSLNISVCNVYNEARTAALFFQAISSPREKSHPPLPAAAAEAGPVTNLTRDPPFFSRFQMRNVYAPATRCFSCLLRNGRNTN